ncbi:MAG: CAP domain-containing protein [Proteobacteria bacterium]|nr:CAP domain-containing protein [Pseudomonadota bacterium]
MTRIIIALFIAAFALSACDTGQQSGGKGSGIFHIGAADGGKIQFRILDSINALRQASGLQTIELSAELTAAAATHSRDMSIQNRPWHFGSDGSSPPDRVARAGYAGPMLGEAISETFESDVATLSAWMENDDTRSVILDNNARFMGISWFQEVNGKIWWTLVIGGGSVFDESYLW